MINKFNKVRLLSLGSVLALVVQAISLSVAAVLPVQASGNVIYQQDGARFMTIATSTESYTIGLNFNSQEAMKFSPASYPASYVVNVRAVLNSQAVNASSFSCNFYNGTSWISNTGTASISTLAADSASISCLITANSAGQFEFEVGSARTVHNHGWTRLIFDPVASAPTVTSAATSGDGRSVRLNLSSSVGTGSGGPGSDFAVSVNGQAVPVQSVARNGNRLDLELGMFQIGRASTVTVAKVGSTYDYGTAPNVLANFSARGVTNNSTATIANQSSSGAGGSATPAAPIKYSGPEFSGLSLKPALAGSSATLEGRKLDQISSVTIGGKAAVLSNATDKSVNIGLPAGLTPGVYDLVVTTASHGKLTHMNAIRIREELPSTSLTIKGTGVLSGEEFKKLTAFARTQNPDMNTVTCIVNSGSEGKSFTQARALCDRIAAVNLNIKTTQFEVRSTVKSSAVFARVVFSSEQ